MRAIADSPPSDLENLLLERIGWVDDLDVDLAVTLTQNAALVHLYPCVAYAVEPLCAGIRGTTRIACPPMQSPLTNHPGGYSGLGVNLV